MRTILKDDDVNHLLKHLSRRKLRIRLGSWRPRASSASTPSRWSTPTLTADDTGGQRCAAVGRLRRHLRLLADPGRLAPGAQWVRFHPLQLPDQGHRHRKMLVS